MVAKETILNTQFDLISTKHTGITKYDPSKQYVHYPSILNLLSDFKDNSSFLDVGCGDGIVSRKLIKKYPNSRILGYDIAPEQINLAKSFENNTTRNIKYEIASQYSFYNNNLFDVAFSVLVLPYAVNFEALKKFFSSSYENTKTDGKFISIIFNPNFKGFDKINYRRKFNKSDNSNVRIDFYNNNDEYYFSSNISNFSKAEYEEASREAGYNGLKWINLKVSKNGIKKMGKPFWNNYEIDCPYIAVICEK